MYLSLTAATALYHLIPTPVALLGAVGVGACAAAIAVRWDSRTVAGLGIVGTLLAPLLATTNTTAAIAFLLVAWAAASAVCLWRRWTGSRCSPSPSPMPQIAVWTFLRPLTGRDRRRSLRRRGARPRGRGRLRASRPGGHAAPVGCRCSRFSAR